MLFHQQRTHELTTADSRPVSWVTHIEHNIFRTDFRSAEDNTCEAVLDLFPPLIEASRAGPLILIPVFPSETRFIDPRQSGLWIDLISKGKLRLSLAAIVTQSAAVRSVGNGFAMALRILTNQPFDLTAKKTFEEAMAWVKEHPNFPTQI
jgi:hypothetical protein